MDFGSGAVRDGRTNIGHADGPPGAAAAAGARQALARLPISKKIAPNLPGAKRWSSRFGDDLVCVRYRVDALAGRRIVTVELRVDEAPLRQRPAPAWVWVRIGRHETELRALARQHGAVWDWGVRAWATTADVVRKLRWMDRIVDFPNGDPSPSREGHGST